MFEFLLFSLLFLVVFLFVYKKVYFKPVSAILVNKDGVYSCSLKPSSKVFRSLLGDDYSVSILAPGLVAIHGDISDGEPSHSYNSVILGTDIIILSYKRLRFRSLLLSDRSLNSLINNIII